MQGLSVLRFVIIAAATLISLYVPCGALAQWSYYCSNGTGASNSTSISCSGSQITYSKFLAVVGHSNKNNTGYSLTASPSGSYITTTTETNVNTNLDVVSTIMLFTSPATETFTASWSSTSAKKQVCSSVYQVNPGRRVSLLQLQNATGTGTSISVPASSYSCSGVATTVIVLGMYNSGSGATTYTTSATELCRVSNTYSDTRALAVLYQVGFGSVGITLTSSNSWGVNVYRLCDTAMPGGGVIYYQ